MRRHLPPAVVGSLALLALVLNTLFWVPFLMATALVRVVVPVPRLVGACRRLAAGIATNWIGFNIRGLKAAGDVEWFVEAPADLRRDGWYLVVSNHLSAADIALLQWLFHRRIPMLKFFLKRELIWVPVLGVAWWALEFPFMRRYPRAVLERRPELRRKDLETTRRACERFRQTPVSILNFVEGTRFTPDKRDRQGAPYRRLLLPRAGGIAQVVSTLGHRLDALLDVTIAYPGRTPTLWDLLCGQVPAVRVHVDAVALDPAWAGRDYSTDAAFREAFQSFVSELWARKDARLEAMSSAGVEPGRD